MPHRSLLLAFFTLALLAPASPLAAQSMEHAKPKREVKVNYGLKGGFTSSMNIVKKFKIADVTIDDVQNNYRIGYMASAFFRVHAGRHFLQPELCYTVSRSEIQFDKRGTQHPDITPDYATIDATLHLIEIPVLYGFDLVKTGIYEMFAYAGPKAQLVWKKKSRMELHNLADRSLHEDLYRFNGSVLLGVGVRISHLLLDFRYDIGIDNVSRRVQYAQLLPDGTIETADITLRRRNNILSFSVGVLF